MTKEDNDEATCSTQPHDVNALEETHWVLYFHIIEKCFWFELHHFSTCSHPITSNNFHTPLDTQVALWHPCGTRQAFYLLLIRPHQRWTLIQQFPDPYCSDRTGFWDILVHDIYSLCLISDAEGCHKPPLFDDLGSSFCELVSFTFVFTLQRFRRFDSSSEPPSFPDSSACIRFPDPYILQMMFYFCDAWLENIKGTKSAPDSWASWRSASLGGDSDWAACSDASGPGGRVQPGAKTFLFLFPRSLGRLFRHVHNIFTHSSSTTSRFVIPL